METSQITFAWATDPNDLLDHLTDVATLIAQLKEGTASETDPSHLPAFIERACTHSHVRIIRDGERLIGFATLVPINKITGFQGHIEDVVVDAAYRGQGFGRILIEQLLEKAASLQMSSVSLTSDPSNPKRAAARELYAKLGFIERQGLFKYQIGT